jgi:hypothetical protein
MDVPNNLTIDKKDVRFLNTTRNTIEASFFEIWRVKMVPRGGIEPPTRGFSVFSSLFLSNSSYF